VVRPRSPEWIDGWNTATAEQCFEVKTERDRLREALEDIAIYPVGDNGYQDIAREALSRPENERG
jgi:hypothetical protein